MIRKIKCDELAELYRLFKENILHSWSYRSTESYYNESPDRFIGFFDGDVMLGYAIFNIVFDECEILSIAVSDNARRRGIGRELLSEIISRSKKAGVTRLFLEVRSKNCTAYSFYSALGFVPIGKRLAYYRDPTDDAISMCLNL